VLGGQSTLCRLEAWANREAAIAPDARPERFVERPLRLVEQLFKLAGKKQLEFFRLDYPAGTSERSHTAIARL